MMKYIELIEPYIKDQKKFDEYLNFIESHRVEKSPDYYTEDHHIIPRSVLKENCSTEEYKLREKDPDVIATLKAEDHFYAHWLLKNACKGNKFTIKYMVSICSKSTSWDETIPEEMAKVYGVVRKNISISNSEKLKGKPKSEEHKKHLSESNKGQTPWIKGKHHTEETKQKMSELKKENNNPFYGKHHTDKTKSKLSEANKGLHYYNNGVICVRKRECPEGFVKGRLI